MSADEMLTKVAPSALTLAWSVCTWPRTTNPMPSAATSGWRETRALRAAWVSWVKVPVTSVSECQQGKAILVY